MCGIIAAICSSQPDYRVATSLNKFMTQATYVGSLRGRDSTGVMYLNRKDVGQEPSVIKKAVDGAIFIDMENPKKVLDNCEDNFFTVVHNRLATQGGVNDKNAHPFQVGNVTLVHNGTLRNHRSLPKGSDYTVDSQAVAAALNFKEPNEAIDILKRLQGAYVLFWYDKRDNSLNMAKNDERPLSVVHVLGEDIMLAASEKEMLEWLVGRNDFNTGPVLKPASFTHFKWELEHGKATTNYTSTKYEPEQTATVYSNSYPKSSTSYSHNGKRAQRMADIDQRFGVKKGDTLEFIAYEFEPYYNNPDEGIIKGYDVSYQFETIAYMQKRADYVKDAHYLGELSVVRDDGGYPDWPTMVVTEVIQLDEDEDGLKEEPEHEKKSCQSEENCCHSNTDEAIKEFFRNELEQSRLVKGPGDVMIPVAEWEDLTRYGCSNCQCNLESPDDVKWTFNEDALCEMCYYDLNYGGNNGKVGYKQ